MLVNSCASTYGRSHPARGQVEPPGSGASLICKTSYCHHSPRTSELYYQTFDRQPLAKRHQQDVPVAGSTDVVQVNKYDVKQHQPHVSGARVQVSCCSEVRGSGWSMWWSNFRPLSAAGNVGTPVGPSTRGEVCRWMVREVRACVMRGTQEVDCRTRDEARRHGSRLHWQQIQC